MTSSRRLRLSPLAEEDLRDTLQYSEENWGTRQRDAFAGVFEAAFQRIARYPEIGPARDDLHPGLRGFVVREHVILYRVEPALIRVLRIIHTRRPMPGQIED